LPLAGDVLVDGSVALTAYLPPKEDF
jgi:hypothetical protein